ncbi:MAG: hypothetical protein NZM12_10610 [Steroidobacteraceae bacterium]|nr:hypothetical protein [Steroidobacteraceae bacterium]MDW8259318.1 ChuX/HutX family heme-like substrate-binding protein [Gammaproteobacteria bacterium]
MKLTAILATVALAAALTDSSARAAGGTSAHCATSAEAQRVVEFYRTHPGTMPAIAARRLALPEARVVSSLPAAQAASASGRHFAEVWNAMTRWRRATFLIMKGANVFEVESGVAPIKPSKTSQYHNIEYTQPLRGHLRPDQYTAIYAIAIPGKDGAVARGVLFFDDSGESVFGAFVSGEGEPPAAEEIAKFDAVMQLVRSKGPVCAAAPAR